MEKNKMKGISLTLSKEKSEEFFYNALCNGLAHIGDYGLEVDFDQKAYDKARKKLEGPCYEDVLMQLLRDGGEIIFVDVEGDGEHTTTISIKDVHEKVQKTPFSHLDDMINENDDSVTADVIIQSVLFDGEIIFG